MDEVVAQQKIYEMSFQMFIHITSLKWKKGRSQDELHKIVTWLTGYSESTLQEALDDQRSFKVFFEAPL